MSSFSVRSRFIRSQERRIILEANCVNRPGDPLGGAIDNPLRHAARHYPHQLLEEPAADRLPFSCLRSINQNGAGTRLLGFESSDTSRPEFLLDAKLRNPVLFKDVIQTFYNVVISRSRIAPTKATRGTRALPLLLVGFCFG